MTCYVTQCLPGCKDRVMNILQVSLLLVSLLSLVLSSQSNDNHLNELKRKERSDSDDVQHNKKQKVDVEAKEELEPSPAILINVNNSSEKQEKDEAPKIKAEIPDQSHKFIVENCIESKDKAIHTPLNTNNLKKSKNSWLSETTNSWTLSESLTITSTLTDHNIIVEEVTRELLQKDIEELKKAIEQTKRENITDKYAWVASLLNHGRQILIDDKNALLRKMQNSKKDG